MSGLAIKSYNNQILDVPTSLEAVTASLCGCNSGCFHLEWVFASATDDFWKKDYTDFLFTKVVASDTITIKLYKDCTELVTISDNTYGTYYNGFTDAPLYVGWLADWTLIFNAFGGGQYQVKTDFNILGNSYTVESRKFRLAAYDEDLTQDTVKIETYQTGNILRSKFDYSLIVSDLPEGWYSSIRVDGKFGFKTPVLEQDNYLDTSYNVLQIRPSVNYEYQLQTQLIPDTLASVINSDNILANKILLTDYSILNDEQLRRIEVIPESYEDVTHYNNGKSKYTILFKEAKQDIIKRNF